MALVVAGFLAACNAGAPPTPDRTGTADPSWSVAPSLGPSTDIRGKFDVGGYSLYLECEGPPGTPIVIYLHGMEGSTRSAQTLPSLLTDRVRWCSYDRANAGQSDPVEERRLGSAFARELHALMAAAGMTGPFVLAGASHGGLIALEYAELYPSEVSGMVLIDGTLPHLREIYALIPEEDRAVQVAATENNPERVEAFATIDEAGAALNRLPDVPMTFMLAVPPVAEEPSTWPVDEIRALDRQRAGEFVARFTEGRLVVVESPHYMEPSVPDEIAAEILRVVDLASD
jgi:pimeloyl-ACP methyl ester carboxylesterase